MFGKQMIGLQVRKQALLLESDLNRLRFLAEIDNLRESTSFVKNLRRFGSWAALLVPVAGVIAVLVLKRSSLTGGILRLAMAGAPEWIRVWRSVARLFAELR